MAKHDDDGGQGLSVVKGALIGLGAIAAVSLALKLFWPMLFVAMVAGAGYVGYRAFGKTKELQAGKDRKALSSSDFDRRMRELEAADRELDAEIRKHR